MIGCTSRGLNRSKRKKLLWITLGFIFFVFLLDRLNPPEDSDILYGDTNLRTVIRAESSAVAAVDADSSAEGDESARHEQEVRPHYFVIRGFLLGIVCAYIFNRLAELVIVMMIAEFLVLFSMCTKGWIVIHWGVLSELFFGIFNPVNLVSFFVSNIFSIGFFCLGIYCGQILSAYMERPKYLRSA